MQVLWSAWDFLRKVLCVARFHSSSRKQWCALPEYSAWSFWVLNFSLSGMILNRVMGAAVILKHMRYHAWAFLVTVCEGSFTWPSDSLNSHGSSCHTEASTVLCIDNFYHPFFGGKLSLNESNDFDSSQAPSVILNLAQRSAPMLEITTFTRKFQFYGIIKFFSTQQQSHQTQCRILCKRFWWKYVCGKFWLRRIAWFWETVSLKPVHNSARRHEVVKLFWVEYPMFVQTPSGHTEATAVLYSS